MTKQFVYYSQKKLFLGRRVNNHHTGVVERGVSLKDDADKSSERGGKGERLFVTFL
jgi:hypothetical protein